MIGSGWQLPAPPGGLISSRFAVNGGASSIGSSQSWIWDCGERSPLQQVEPVAGERPLEIVATGEDLAAAQRECAQRRELTVVEAEHVCEPVGNLPFACAAFRFDAYGDVLQSGDSLDDGTVTP